MGSSASATIIYGFPFKGDDFDFDDAYYHNDPEKWLAKFQGLPEPDGDYESNAVDTVCDGDMMSGQTTTYLVIREASLDGDWCGPTQIPVGHVKPPPPEWDELLRVFCDKAGVSFQQPDWCLIANYG